ncbi:MAG: SPFH domain-containing protein, partial [Alphaproteobacteria bacterium]
MDQGSIVLLAILAVVVVTILMGVKTVPQGQEWTVERLGRYTRTLSPGLSVIIPYIDRIGSKLSMMETVLDIPSQEVISKDNATVTADGVMFFQVLDAAKAAYEVQNLNIALTNLAMTNIRSVIGAMDLDEALSQRDHINAKLLAVIDQATTPWGVKVTRIELRNIQPPANLLEAMGKQMTAERSKRADILTAEGDKQAAILRAEGQKQSAILEAEGRREAAFRDAEARERLAAAEAKATQMVSEAIAGGSATAVNYFVAQKYVEALGKFADSPNQKTFLMPVEATAVLGSLAGIAELARAAAAA